MLRVPLLSSFPLVILRWTPTMPARPLPRLAPHTVAPDAIAASATSANRLYSGSPLRWRISARRSATSARSNATSCRSAASSGPQFGTGPLPAASSASSSIAIATRRARRHWSPRQKSMARASEKHFTQRRRSSVTWTGCREHASHFVAPCIFSLDAQQFASCQHMIMMH